ncbi:MAG: hypothetical protein KIT85_08885 [Pseudolabrys sp.]|nr:hypothetical protein [Pseudolabrys sp.]
MSKKSHRNAASSPGSTSSLPHRTTARNQSDLADALAARIPGYSKERFPHLQLDQDAALRLLDLVDPAFRKWVGPDKIQSFIGKLEALHVSAYTEHMRSPRNLRSNVNLEKLSKEIDRFHDTLLMIESTLSPLFNATSILFESNPLWKSFDPPGAPPRDFDSSLDDLIRSSQYLQSIVIKIHSLARDFEEISLDAQEDFFFRGKSGRERRAFQTIYAFIKKGGGFGATTFIARQIAAIYKLTFGSSVTYSRLKNDYSRAQKRKKLTSTERQFHDGNSLRFACVLIRELRLDDFMERDLLTDRDAPFPWLETAKGIQNNPWEQVKNKIGTIWENDKKRPNKSQIFSWMTPETSK